MDLANSLDDHASAGLAAWANAALAPQSSWMSAKRLHRLRVTPCGSGLVESQYESLKATAVGGTKGVFRQRIGVEVDNAGEHAA